MIDIVIPVFNRASFTRDCLLSLKNQSFKDYRVIVVDDGSTDDTPQMLASGFPEVTVLRTKGDLFWTASVNLGIRHALDRGADWIMTLNNDTVASDSFLTGMARWIREKPSAIFGSLAVEESTGRIAYGGARIRWWDASYLPLKPGGKELAGCRQGIHRVDHFPGRGLLIPREVFESIGLFDERRFPHYMADFEFTYRAHRKGYELYCNYDAVLYTYPEESGDRKNRQEKAVRKYLNHLFSIKGGGNLLNFTRFALRHCPPAVLAPHLAAGYIKRVVGYWVK
jgi:GT2 family glycosyltransferase